MSTETETVRGFVTGLLDLRFDRTTTAVVAMLGLDALWWVMMYDGHVPMPGMKWLMMNAKIPMAAPGAMELGVFHVGTVDAVLGYLTMWGVMMWAMMHPAMTRFTREYAQAHNGSTTDVTAAVASFFTSYHLVWTVSGIVPLLFHALLPGGIYGFTQEYTALVIGGVLVLTGLYQLSPFKRSLLRTCCAEIENHEDGIGTAFQEGLIHGARCVLVCFGPFFLLMPFFGEMNFFWMVALTAIVTIERLPEWGQEVAIATGLVSLLAGIGVVLAQPDLPLTFTMSM